MIGRAHLVRNKRACARPKDLADLALLDEVARAKEKEKPVRRKARRLPRKK